MYRKGQPLGREPERRDRGPAPRPPGASRPSSGPGPSRGPQHAGPPLSGRPRPAGPGPGPGGRYPSRPPQKRNLGPREAQREKLRLQAVEFSKQYQIPEDVAFQIVRGDFTFKEWMERHEVALQKREKRQAYEQVRKQIRARDEGLARQFFLKQKKNAVPMVFICYGGVRLDGVITGILPYYFYLGEGKAQQKHEKLSMLYCYKKEHENEVRASLERDTEVAAQALVAQRDKSARPPIPENELKSSIDEKKEVRFTLHDGSVFAGTIDWYSKYNVKVRLSEKASVVLFTHAVYELKASEKSAT